MKILVIEDEKFILDSITRILEDEGYSVTGVQDFPTAVKTIQSENFNMVITDVMLPFSGGFDIVDLVKEDPEKQHLPVIVITGMDKNILNSTISKADSCLTKPFTSIQLKGLVKKYLN